MKGPSSLVGRKETALFGILLFLVLLGGFLAVSYGSWSIEKQDVLQILLAKCGLYDGPIDKVESTIVWDGRMPRLLAAFLVGFSLAAAGAVMQGVFKNPMASPV